MKKMISIDPGKNMGFCIFPDIDSSPTYTDFGSVYGEEEIWKWLGRNRADLWVVEDYLIRDERHGGFDHQWQSVFPAQVIGAIKFWAYNTGAVVVLQQPSIKNAASRMIFRKPYVKSSSKKQHALDAVLHGCYYLKTKVTR